jgi:copper transport protein
VVRPAAGSQTRRHGTRRPLLASALAASIATLAIAAPQASAHAQLLGTSPASGSTVAKQPGEVIFEFDQNVGGTLGAVRVYDAQGKEVDDLDVSHPDGDEHWMGVGLQSKLADGTYTATYRVVSADTHIVYGGLVFNIGHAGAPPKFTVAGLIAKNRSGQVTEIAFGAVRGLDYLTLALMIGGLAFLFFAWLPGLTAVAGPEERWAGASQAFASRIRTLLAVAIVVGALVSLLGILLQGASAAGVSLWSSLKSSVYENTLDTRFGEIWGLRLIVWLLLGALLIAARASDRDVVPALDLEGPGPDGPGHGVAERAQRPTRARSPAPAILALLGLCCAYLAMTPALAGHASIQSPTFVFFAADVLHVLAASVWVGGIACLLFALPRATGLLQSPERSELLLATLARFSKLALGAVIAIAATGAIDAYIDVRSVSGLLHTTYGVLILVKVALFGVLVALGWVNRTRIIPGLRRIAGERRAPGEAGVQARRSLRGELVLMMSVFGVTAALVAYAPPIDAASGPFSTNTAIGDAELEMTVEPAKVGLNTIHLYLIDARTGAQFTQTKELTANAKLPAKDIGPLPLHANPAGPGHYIFSSAVLSPGGDWDIEIVDRVSEFEENTKVVQVPID